MKNKRLIGTGEYTYDSESDLAIFKVKNRNYSFSVECSEFVIDFDKENNISGLRIFDAAKVFNLTKEYLKSLTNWEFKVDIEDNTINIRLYLNKEIEENINSPIELDVYSSSFTCASA